MLKQLFYTVLTVLCLISLNGCLVAKSDYLKKVEEVDTLTKNLTDIQQRHQKLASDNSALKAQFEKLKVETAGLDRDRLVLTTDKQQLEELLKAKSDTLSKNITDLRQKISDLETGMRKMMDEMNSLGGKAEEEARRKEKLIEKKSGIFGEVKENAGKVFGDVELA